MNCMLNAMQCNACLLQSDNHCSIWLFDCFSYLLVIICITQHSFGATQDVDEYCGQG